MISGPASREPANFDLWTWNGETGVPAHRVVVPGLPGFEKAEGVSPAFIGGMERIGLVKDDGNRNDGRSASSCWTPTNCGPRPEESPAVEHRCCRLTALWQVKARFAIAVVGQLPYVARLPGVLTHGPDWLWSYLGDGSGSAPSARRSPTHRTPPQIR